MQGDRQLLYGGMGRLSESSVVSIKNKSHAVTAEIEVPDGGAQGVIVAQGGSIGGWSLYLKDGKPRYCYNLLGIQRFYVDSRDGRCPRARTRCGWSSPTTAPGSARAAPSTLYVDGDKVGEGQGRRDGRDDLLRRRHLRRRTRRTARSSPTTTPCRTRSPARSTGSRSTSGKAAEDADHQIDPDELFRVAMARQ